MGRIEGLKSFPKMDGLPKRESEQAMSLWGSSVSRVVCFSLGPEGTNIAQASREWLKKMKLTGKSEVVLCDTPEECLERARMVHDAGVLAVYWTCAVYAHESEFFFGNPDVLPFFFQETMPLDEMQLATVAFRVNEVVGGCVPSTWRISSHPSPQHLLRGLNIREIVLVNSNAAAAIHCKEGKSEACITTESARKIHNLHTLHLFGCPPMVFFGGITPDGADLMKVAFKKACSV